MDCPRWLRKVRQVLPIVLLLMILAVEVLLYDFLLSHGLWWQNNMDEIRALIGILFEITAIATMIAGLYLYKKGRKSKYRANISHSIEHVKMPDQRILLIVSLKIENKGSVLLALNKVTTRIEILRPLKIEEIPEEPLKKRTEMGWPPGEERELEEIGSLKDIEPEETDSFLFDFLLDKSLEAIRIYSYIENPQRKDKGWDINTTYVINNALNAAEKKRRRENRGKTARFKKTIKRTEFN
jgi:hypothetical protein